MLFNVAIDGPAGSGKTSVTFQLAKELGLQYLDTGATYRAATLGCIENNIKSTDEDGCRQMAQQVDVEFNPSDGKQITRFKQRDVSARIRDDDVTARVSEYSAVPVIRHTLVAYQQKISEKGGFIAEGRDIGTVVFKDSPCKIYLSASPEVRAERRAHEIQSKGLHTDKPFQQLKEEILQSITERDFSDSTRTLAPLAIDAHATIFDTSSLTVDEVVAQLKAHIEQTIQGLSDK
ncbi:putative Cytidylate kinase [Blattamonas nauphoetae]|uniref:(d)CMP kinase n=1 Tax=Blattamonas nauphoetae TaxID=2049346 RepID=A0ABQ9XM91_9EUKA|nr:putative Cytidylate kinase [Blattamonas nauphoetae]